MTHSATIATLKSLGATVTPIRLGQGATQLVVRHRGATVDVWPRSGKWRPRAIRRIGHGLPKVQRTGLDSLIAILTADQLPEWMTRRAA